MGDTMGDIELVSSRLDFLQALADEPLAKRDIVDALDHSRSTVDRAIRSLVDAGFVERIDGSYRTTTTGQLAAERYQQFCREEADILAAREILSALPPETDIPARVLAGSSVETGEDAYWLFERVAELVRTARSYHAVLPQLVDSRHLRLCRARVDRGELAMSVFADDPALTRLREEFPRLATALAETDAVTIGRTKTPPYGLLIAERDATTTVMLVAYDDDGIAGVVRNDTEAAVEWARDQLTAVRERATDASEMLADSDTEAVSTLAEGDRLAPRLRTQGFARVDGAFFDRREPMDPETGWRAGLGIPEVAAGYDIDRHDDSGQPMAPTLAERLRAGSDIALIGPAGSGKSTVCKQVAYTWFENATGPVFYREGGSGQPFDAVGTLEASLDAANGHALVVVEDAVRSDANAIFEVMQALSGRSDVSFLLDAREGEWHDTDALPVDARLEAFRQQAIETMTMPSLDEFDCQRIADRFEELLDSDFNPDVSSLLSTVEDTDGSAYLLFHRLSSYVDPLTGFDERTSTSLDEDVDQVRRRLEEAGDAALSVGVLVNVLNAAERAFNPAAPHALTARTEVSSEDVSAALEQLHGRVYFPGANGTRTVHAAWSVRFLERFLAEHGDAAAEERFGRVLSALLALADDPERRETVATAVPDTESYASEIAADPAGWASDLLEQVFDVGREHSQLAPLFGTTDDSSLTLPDACPELTRLECRRWRGDIYQRRGEYDIALSEYRQLIEACPSPEAAESDAAVRLYIRAQLGRSSTERYRGSAERALEHVSSALSAARELGDTELEARALLERGAVAETSGEFETAIDNYQQSQAAAGDWELHDAMVQRRIAQLEWKQNNFEAAADRFERALESSRAIGYRKGEMLSLTLLAEVIRKLGDLETAIQYKTRALEIARSIGDRDTETTVLITLGSLLSQRGEWGTATDYHEQALAAAREEGPPLRVAQAQLFRSIVQRRQGNTDEAVRLARDALDALGESSPPMVEARIQVGLAQALLADEEYDEAAEIAEQALAVFTDSGFTIGIGQANRVLGLVALARESFETAEERLQKALEKATATADQGKVVHTRLALAALAVHRDETDRANALVDSAVELGQETDYAQTTLNGLERVIEATDAVGMPEAGREWTETAVEIASEAGLDDHREQFEQRLTGRKTNEVAGE